MSTFRLQINVDNDEFQGAGLRRGIRRILKEVEQRVREGSPIDCYQTIFDINGNRVGQFAVKRDDE